MPDTRPDRYRDQDGEVIPPVIEEPDIIPPGSHLPYRVRRTYCTGLENGLMSLAGVWAQLNASSECAMMVSHEWHEVVQRGNAGGTHG